MLSITWNRRSDRSASHPPDEDPANIPSRYNFDERIKDIEAGNCPWDDILFTFDGGGVRGYSSLLILKALMERIDHVERETQKVCAPADKLDLPARHLHDKPSTYADYAIGTSTGGLSALMIGRLDMNIKDCLAQYRINLERIFGVRRYLKTLQRYSARNFEETIRSLSDGEKVKLQHGNPDSIACRAAVYAVELGVGKPKEVAMRTYKVPTLGVFIPRWGAVVEDIIPEVWLQDAARATCAAPGYFTPKVMKGRHFVDGGLMVNNPTIVAIDEVQKMRSGLKFAAERSFGLQDGHRVAGARLGASSLTGIAMVVSFGTVLKEERTLPIEGPKEIKRNPLGLLSKLPQVFGYLKHQITDTSKPHVDALELCERQGIPYFRFNAGRRLEGFHLNECKKDTLENLETETKKYLALAEVKEALHKCATIAVAYRLGRERWKVCHGALGHDPPSTPAAAAVPVYIASQLEALSTRTTALAGDVSKLAGEARTMSNHSGETTNRLNEAPEAPSGAAAASDDVVAVLDDTDAVPDGAAGQASGNAPSSNLTVGPSTDNADGVVVTAPQDDTGEHVAVENPSNDDRSADAAPKRSARRLLKENFRSLFRKRPAAEEPR